MIKIKTVLDVEKYLEDIDSVIFDLDDTLFSEKDYVKSGFRKISQYFSQIPNLNEELWNAFEAGLPAIDYVFAKHNLIENKDTALNIYRFHIPQIELYEGVSEMISRIREMKSVGIITDGRPEGQRAKLEALKLDVDEVIITDELGGIQYRKPNKAAFVLMAERLRTPYDRMVYIGDNIKKDFDAPLDLGMKAIHFDNQDGLYAKKEDR